jgi:hypothetical protein
MMFPKLLAGAVGVGAIVGTSATQTGHAQTVSARDVVAHYRLDVQTISPAHSVVRGHPDALTRDQAEELLKGGTERARQHCAAEQAKGSKYY